MKEIDLTELVSFRKELHRNPEISCQEFETAKRVKNFLQKCNPDEIIENLGKTGIAAIYKGKNPGKTVLLRCELDALPIQEINSFEHKSVNEGVSHKCGHDGHTTILCGVAKMLMHNQPENGNVILLFQPAEENGKGAADVIADNNFSKIKPDYAFALHNLPGFKASQIVVKNGAFTSAVNSIIIKLKGKTAHAGEPHMGINPALAMAEITQELHKLTVTDISKEDFCLVTPVYAHMGERAYGVSAGAGEVHFTLRCGNNERMSEIEKKAEQIVVDVAKKYKLEVEISWTESFFANQNDEQAVDWIREAAKSNDLEIMETKVPFGWGEDFGLFTDQFKGAMFGLGAGEDMPALHNPDYDFPDEIIPAGVKIFYSIIQKVTHV